MKNKISIIFGSFVCLVALGINIQYANNGYGIVTQNQHSEVLAQAAGASGAGDVTGECVSKPRKGYGDCYEIHSIGCITEISIWPFKIVRGDKKRCRLLQPYGAGDGCKSSDEIACGGSGTGTREDIPAE
jgi:hypothetical protein